VSAGQTLEIIDGEFCPGPGVGEEVFGGPLIQEGFSHAARRDPIHGRSHFLEGSFYLSDGVLFVGHCRLHNVWAKVLP
jgi:hypothetical protein